MAVFRSVDLNVDLYERKYISLEHQLEYRYVAATTNWDADTYFARRRQSAFLVDNDIKFVTGTIKNHRELGREYRFLNEEDKNLFLLMFGEHYRG
jgi:hypothetical protein